MKKLFLTIIPLFMLPLVIMAQIRVEGTVVDNQDYPIPGLNIYIKGTTSGTITDINGNYQLPDVPGDGILVFSSVGMKTQEIEVNNRSQINLTMEEEIAGLEEIVIIGYGTVKRRDLTGAVSSVKNEDLTMAPVSNAMEALQGRVAGLDITRTSGRAGSEPEVLLRGTRSLTASNAPLYIIDGIPGSIATLNPNDIQSIEVLKDASSTAIYGSAGANGVIIVTTKQAEKGTVQIDVNSYYGVNGFASYPSALQGQDWLNYLEEGYRAAYDRNSEDRSELLTAYNLAPDQLNPYIENGKWVDWVDETLRTGTQQNHSVSIRGGSERTRAHFSLGYTQEQGIYKDDKTEIATMRSGVEHEFKDWLSAGIQTSLNWRDRNIRGSRINSAFSTIPLGDVYDVAGNINAEPIEGHSTVSLLADEVPGVYKNNGKQIRATANPFIDIKPIKNLNIRSVLGTTLTTNRTGEYNSDRTYMKLIGSGSQIKTASYTNSLSYAYTWENIANYSFDVADDHSFQLTGITSWSNSQNESGYGYNEGFDYDEFIYYNMNAGNNPSVGSNYSHTKKMSYAARVNYNYQGKYLLTISNRWDGASQLADKWDAFPAAALAWRISDEDFMAGTYHWMTNLKLRLGYGVTGNANINPYVTSTEVQSSPYNLSLGSAQNQVYIPTQAVGNPMVGWEKSYNTNIGLDLGLYNNRIDLVFEWYNTDTKDVLFNRPLPSSSGAYSSKGSYNMMSNIAEVNNQGIELAINTRNIINRAFNWETTLTFARNREEVKAIDLGSNIEVDDLIALNLFMGQPVNTIYGYKKLGIWQLDEADEAALYGSEPGQVKIATVEQFDDEGNGDDGIHPYSAKDRQILGSRTPDWTMGFQNSFYFKNFDLNIFATMRWGQMLDADLMGYFTYNRINLPSTYNYWTPENPTNDFPRPNILGNNNDVALRSLRYVDGSYMKIRNITLGYTLPMTIGESLGVKKLRVYGTVNNPFIFTKSDLLKDIDPESGGGDTFPLFKQVIFGVNLSF